MTKKTKIHQDPRKLIRGIVIGAGVVAAAYFSPKAIRFTSDRWQDADYAEEHHAIKELNEILKDREANALREGQHDDTQDPFVQSIQKELKFRQKRHSTERLSAKCKYCEEERK